MPNLSEIDDALSVALNAIAAAQTSLRKSASPREIDVLRKAASQPRASNGDAVVKAAQSALEDLNARLDRLEAGRDLDAQFTIRKTMTP